MQLSPQFNQKCEALWAHKRVSESIQIQEDYESGICRSKNRIPLTDLAAICVLNSTQGRILVCVAAYSGQRIMRPLAYRTLRDRASNSARRQRQEIAKQTKMKWAPVSDSASEAFRCPDYVPCPTIRGSRAEPAYRTLRISQSECAPSGVSNSASFDLGAPSAREAANSLFGPPARPIDESFG